MPRWGHVSMHGMPTHCVILYDACMHVYVCSYMCACMHGMSPYHMGVLYILICLYIIFYYVWMRVWHVSGLYIWSSSLFRLVNKLITKPGLAHQAWNLWAQACLKTSGSMRSSLNRSSRHPSTNRSIRGPALFWCYLFMFNIFVNLINDCWWYVNLMRW